MLRLLNFRIGSQLASQDVPLAGVLVGGDDFVGGPPDVGVLVPVELLEGLVNPVLESGWAAVADDVQDPGPDPDVFVANQLEDSLPEDLDVLEALAWAELLDCFESDVVVFAVGVLEDEVHVLGVPADGHDFLLVKVGYALVLLLIVLTLRHNNLLSAVVRNHSNLKHLFNSLIKLYLSNSYQSGLRAQNASSQSFFPQRVEL